MTEPEEPPFDPKILVTQKVVLEDPGMDAVRVRTGLVYRVVNGEPLHFRLYLPPDDVPAAAGDASYPVAVLVLGYSDAGARHMFGCDLADLAAYDCWARLLACQGIAAITYQTLDPADDIAALHEYLKAEAGNLPIDINRIGVWSCSGNVPNALGFIGSRPELKCAALCYGYTLDVDGRTDIADMSRQIGFVVPAGKNTIDALPPVPMLLVKAGRDETPALNDSLDRFHAAATARQLPVTMIEHATGPHAFDIFDDSDESRRAIRAVLDFLRDKLAR